MNILEYFDDLIEKFKIGTWKEEDRKKLFRVLQEVYEVDDVYSESERKEFANIVSGIDIDETEIKHMDFQESLHTLHSDESKRDILYFWIATALYSDDDFDDREKIFVEKIIPKYELDEAKFRAALKDIRDKKTSDILESWLRDEES